MNNQDVLIHVFFPFISISGYNFYFIVLEEAFEYLSREW